MKVKLLPSGRILDAQLTKGFVSLSEGKKLITTMTLERWKQRTSGESPDIDTLGRKFLSA